MNINITPAEQAKIATVISNGHTITSIDKNKNHFRVNYKIRETQASVSIVYNLRAEMHEIIENLKALEENL